MSIKVWAKIYDTYMGQCLVQLDRESGVWGVRVSFCANVTVGTGRFDQFYEPKFGVEAQDMFNILEQEDANEAAGIFEEMLKDKELQQ